MILILIASTFFFRSKPKNAVIISKIVMASIVDTIPKPVRVDEGGGLRVGNTRVLRALLLADRPGGGKPEWTNNMLLRHGVRSCLEYAKSFDLKRALALSNPQLAPHLEFVDWGGHGYAKVRLTANEMRTEFVCIPRPITRSERPDGGPLRYRVALVAKLWKPGERPHLDQQVLEGDVELSI